MNKHIGHLLVLAAFLGLGKGLGRGAGGGTGKSGGLGGGLGGAFGGGGGAGSVVGTSNAGAAGSSIDAARSGHLGSGSLPAPKNATLDSSGDGGGGGATGSAGGPEGLGGHPSPGGSPSGLSEGVDTTGRSTGFAGGSSEGNCNRDLGGPGGAASDFGGFGIDSLFGNLHAGFSSPSVGGGAVTGGSAGGAGEFDGDTFSGGDRGFRNGFGTGWAPDGSAESSFPTRGAGFGDGRPGGLGAWSAGGNPYGGEGGYGFGGLNGDSEFGNFDSGFGFPAGVGGGLGPGGRGSGEEAGAFSAPLPGSEPGELFSSGTGHGGAFPSTSGYAPSSTGESPHFGSNTPDSSNGPSSSLADVPGGSGHRRLLSRLWPGGRRGPGPFGLGHRRRKTDPRLAAAVALGAVAGVAALGSLSVGIAAAMHARRRSGVVGLGRARRGCVSGDSHRKRRSIPVSKVPAEILDGLPMNFERL